MRRPSRIQSNRISNTPRRSGPRNVFGRMITLSSGDERTSSSHAIFDSPYAPTPCKGKFSDSGCTFGTPYTAVDEM